MAEKFRVLFEGKGEGCAGLSWGQQTIWRGIEMRGTPAMLTGVLPLPEGTTVEDVAGVLGYLMSRNQTLRTFFPIGADGQPRQVVRRSGETFLEIVDAADDDDPREIAGALESRYESAERDYASEWPIRMGVVRHRGVPAYRVTAVDHLTTDGFGVMAMLGDLASRDPVTGLPGRPVRATPALEQAQWQAGPRGQRQSEAAARYWDGLLRAIPARRFPGLADPRSPRYWMANFRSSATFLAMTAIAQRANVDTTPVLLAAFATGLAHTSGASPVVPRVMVSNRFRPGFADTVSPVAQTCPCVIDVAGLTFDEVVTRTARATLATYKHAYFEPARIREVVAAVGKDRGEELDLDCVYNDRRLVSPRTAEGPPPSRRDITAALAGTELRCAPRSDEPLDECHIHILDSPDAVTAEVHFDTCYVGPAAVETMLRQVEAVTVAAAADPGTLAWAPPVSS